MRSASLNMKFCSINTAPYIGEHDSYKAWHDRSIGTPGSLLTPKNGTRDPNEKKKKKKKKKKKTGNHCRNSDGSACKFNDRKVMNLSRTTSTPAPVIR